MFVEERTRILTALHRTPAVRRKRVEPGLRVSTASILRDLADFERAASTDLEVVLTGGQLRRGIPGDGVLGQSSAGRPG